MERVVLSFQMLTVALVEYFIFCCWVHSLYCHPLHNVNVLETRSRGCILSLGLNLFDRSFFAELIPKVFTMLMKAFLFYLLWHIVLLIITANTPVFIFKKTTSINAFIWHRPSQLLRD